MKEKLMYAAAFIMGWSCFWIGHVISKLMNHNMEFLYPTYNTFMGWSLFFNDLVGLNIWIDTRDE
jgi:hypothetical protein